MNESSSKYLLTFKIRIDALDDIEARVIAQNIEDSVSRISIANVEVKLQKIFEDKQPQHMEL